MNASSEAADQLVRITLDGVQTAVKISGEGALQIAKLLIKEIRTKEQTKGRASLARMLKSQKPIRVFQIEDKSLKKFCEEAKRYGVMYHVLKDKSSKSGMCEIMVREEDASKLNRIFERLNIGVNKKAVIKKALEKTKKTDINEPQKHQPEKSAEDRFIDKLFAKPTNREKTEDENPTSATTEKSRPSEHSSKTSGDIGTAHKKGKQYHSVKKLIADINEEKTKNKTEKSTNIHRENKTKSKPKRSSKDVRN